MRPPRTQQGFLAIVAAALIVIVGFIGVVVTYLITGSQRAGVDHLQSAQALFVAESGLEFGIYQWVSSGGTIASGSGNVGAGSFSFTVDKDSSAFPGFPNPLPANQDHVRSTGTVGSARRTVDAIIQAGGGASALDNGDFNLPGVCPPTPASWTNFQQNWAGGNNCLAVPLTAGPDGSPAILARKSGGGGTRFTRARQDLATGCAGPVTVTINFDRRHAGFFSGFFSWGQVTFTLSGTGGPAQSATRYFAGGWQADSLSINVPAGMTVNRFEFDLRAAGFVIFGISSRSWLDNVVMSGCGGATTILSWREALG